MATVAYITVRFEPDYFSKAAFCRIPSKWAADLDNAAEFGVAQLYDTAATRAEAIAGLVAQLKARGFSGRARVSGI